MTARLDGVLHGRLLHARSALKAPPPNEEHENVCNPNQQPDDHTDAEDAQQERRVGELQPVRKAHGKEHGTTCLDGTNQGPPDSELSIGGLRRKLTEPCVCLFYVLCPEVHGLVGPTTRDQAQLFQ